MPSLLCCFGGGLVPEGHTELGRDEVRRQERGTQAQNTAQRASLSPHRPNAQLKLLYERSVALNGGKLFVHGGMPRRCAAARAGQHLCDNVLDSRQLTPRLC
jgi:hypothetical protein